MYFIWTLTAIFAKLECFECNLNDPNCRTSKTSVVCSDGEVCSSFATYLRRNASIPFKKSDGLVTRSCFSVSGNQCSFRDPVWGICVPNIDPPTELNCRSCCSTTKCNNDLPDWTVDTNRAGHAAPSAIVVVVSSLLLAVGAWLNIWIVAMRGGFRKIV